VPSVHRAYEVMLDTGVTHRLCTGHSPHSRPARGLRHRELCPAPRRRRPPRPSPGSAARRAARAIKRASRPQRLPLAGWCCHRAPPHHPGWLLRCQQARQSPDGRLAPGEALARCALLLGALPDSSLCQARGAPDTLWQACT